MYGNVASLSKRYENISIVEVLFHADCYDFEDGTSVIASCENDVVSFYSPRLQKNLLEVFCRVNEDRYRRIWRFNYDAFMQGKLFTIEPFWGEVGETLEGLQLEAC